MLSRCGYTIREMTIGGIISDKARQHGDRVFIKDLVGGRTFNYRDVDQLSSSIAGNLFEKGIGKGAHIASMMDNSPEQLIHFFAVAKLGAVSIPLNTAARGEQLRYFLNQSDTQVLIVDEQFLSEALNAANGLTALTDIIVLGESGIRAGNETSAHITDFNNLLKPSKAAEAIDVTFNDVAAMMYTSGTTGPSKGNVYTHAHSIQFGCDSAETYNYCEKDIFYVCLPLFHSMALHGNTFGTLMGGGTVALTRRFSASKYWEDIRATGATQTAALGSVINILAARPPSPEDTDHKLRFMLTSPIPQFTREFEERFNTKLAGGYGLSDFGHVFAYRLDTPDRKIGSCGQPLPGVEVRIVDEDGLEVEVGEAGEITLRRSQPYSMASGYYKKFTETVEANRQQWFHTGDLARMDADGYMWFVDRKKDAIRRRGENISSYEVEAVLLTHPDVADVAVYPISSEMAEDEVCATIVLRDGCKAITEADIIHYCADNMAYFMVPRFLNFSDSLPRNASQKVEKVKLRAEAEAKRTSLWDREVAGIGVKHPRAASRAQ